jgi:hypothetical protein
MRGLVLVALLLCGCPSPGLVTGLTGVTSQQGYTLNTTQKCVDAARAVEIADIAFPIYWRQLKGAGYIKDVASDMKRLDKVSLCLIVDPEPCRGGGWTRGPFGPKLPGEKYPLAARKHGCASMYGCWSSKKWPPVCRKEWPDEPHCVTADQVSEVGWEKNYVHELYNVAVLRWTRVYSPDYKNDIYQVIGPKVKKRVLDLVK